MSEYWIEQLRKATERREECWRDLVKLKDLFIQHVPDEDLSDEAVKLLAKILATEFKLEHRRYFGIKDD